MAQLYTRPKVFDKALKPAMAVVGSFDLEETVARFPPNYVVKGMFCHRLVDLLGEDFSALRPRLISPPRGGRYLPFNDYPTADFTRIAAACAAKNFSQLGMSEAMRRIAREDFAAFASSTWGRIALTLVGDAHAALLHMPEAFARAAPGPELTAEKVDDHSVRMTLVRFPGLVEYMLGQLEGIVMAFDRSPTTTIRTLGPQAFAFDVVVG